MLGINRLFVAEREQGGFDGFLLAPVDRTAMLVAKAIALFVFLVVRGARRRPGLRAAAARARPRRRCPGCWSCCCSPTSGIAVIGTLVAALAVQTRARDLIVPLLALPLLIPVVIARGARRPRRCSPSGGAEALPGAGWRSSASMIWSSGCSPTPSSTSSWRTERTVYGKGLRPLSLATFVAAHRRVRAGRSSTRPTTPTRASSRRSSTSTCRWRSSRCAGSSPAGSSRSSTCARGDRALGPALLRRDPPVADPRRRRAGHRLDLGARRRGATGGCGTSRRWSRS